MVCQKRGFLARFLIQLGVGYYQVDLLVVRRKRMLSGRSNLEGKTMRRSLFLLPLFALSACMAASPYEQKSNSRPQAELTNNSIQASNGQAYSTRGYIEMFAPNYFVVVGAPDQRSLADDIDGARLAASAAVRRFDCPNGTEFKDGSRYSEQANEWLIVTDCRSGGRSLTGS